MLCIAEPPTAGQALNVSIANIVHYLVTQVKRVLSNMAASLPTTSTTELNKTLANADNLTRQILSPLLSSINDAIEAIILTMHHEDFNKYYFC